MKREPSDKWTLTRWSLELVSGVKKYPDLAPTIGLNQFMAPLLTGH